MAASHVLLGFICAAFIGWCGLSGSGGVGSPSLAKAISPQGGERSKVLNIARSEIGVREVGHNGGKRVGEYLAYTGIKVPAPYCASFVSWCFGRAGYKEPRTAWSPALFPRDRVVQHSSRDLSSGRDDGRWRDDTETSSAQARPGLVFGIYFNELKRIGHCGFVEVVRGEWVQTIEGNTGPEGSREGIGVFRRLRHKRTICKYADWL